MSDKLERIKKVVIAASDNAEARISEIEERYEDGFDPQDWSGGNFDDAYAMGEEEGDARGKYRLASAIISILAEEDE